MIGRLGGQKALVNCIALEENLEEDFVASGSTDTTVRVGLIPTFLLLESSCLSVNLLYLLPLNTHPSVLFKSL